MTYSTFGHLCHRKWHQQRLPGSGQISSDNCDADTIQMSQTSSRCQPVSKRWVTTHQNCETLHLQAWNVPVIFCWAWSFITGRYGCRLRCTVTLKYTPFHGLKWQQPGYHHSWMHSLTTVWSPIKPGLTSKRLSCSSTSQTDRLSFQVLLGFIVSNQ